MFIFPTTLFASGVGGGGGGPPASIKQFTIAAFPYPIVVIETLVDRTSTMANVVVTEK